MKPLIFLLFFSICISAQDLDTELVDINNLKMNLRNNGTFGYNAGNSTTLDSITVMFESGFFIAGIRHDTIWGNGAFNLVYNYIPGNVVKNTNAPYKYYTVRSADSAFGSSWQECKYAVEQGAYFYDGNGNGIYDPIDLNGNGTWDENEDRPDLLGDFTTWCVVNDGDTKISKLPGVATPLDIEIKQTIFAYSPETDPNLSNVIFVRYVIENKNRDGEVLENAYFGIAVDPDIGDYVDDRMGSDSVDNFGYGYNHGADEMFGINPPALLVDLLNGVQSFVPNETFIDNNGNSIFDKGIDTPLDSAVINLGPHLGTEIIEGAKNLAATSITYLGRSHCLRPPDYAYQILNILSGLRPCGDEYDPCTFEWGNFSELDNCENINSKFVFSGNPVTGEGWLNVWHQDTYFIISTGPFRFEPGKPKTINFAIMADRGVDSLNSITVTKDIDKYVQSFYENNFQKPPVGITKTKINIPTEFRLYQNYPNPFNPSTTIKYSIPTRLHPSSSQGKQAGTEFLVTLKVYNVLGREVTTLVNEKKSPGNYEVTFNAVGLPSGVYFDKLTVGDFNAVKKMILMK